VVRRWIWSDGDVYYEEWLIQEAWAFMSWIFFWTFVCVM